MPTPDPLARYLDTDHMMTDHMMTPRILAELRSANPDYTITPDMIKLCLDDVNALLAAPTGRLIDWPEVWRRLKAWWDRQCTGWEFN